MFYGIYAVYAEVRRFGREKEDICAACVSLFLCVGSGLWHEWVAKTAKFPMICDDLRREWEVAHPGHVISRALLDHVIASQRNKESLFQELTCPA